jgi:hypothetical protein
VQLLKAASFLKYFQEREDNRMRKLFVLIAALVMVGQVLHAAREATATINNFTKSGGVYSFDVWARRTGTTAINVGTSSLFFNYNSSALSVPTLSNINAKYTGAEGVDNYDPMTVAVIGGKIGVTITFTAAGGGWSSMSTDPSPGEKLCTVNLTITDPSLQPNLSWDGTNSAFTNGFPSGDVTTTWVGSDEDPLPIQLGSLTASVVNQNEVRVDWTTVTETNNYGFEVQKSAETLTSYQTIANSFVPGHGTTIQPHSYIYTDVTASPGVWYYRLKQIDLDGTAHYTEGVQVDVVTGVKEKEVPTVFALDQNYPNPFNPSTVIEFALPKEEHVVLEVYNLLGQRVATLVNEVRPVGYYAVSFSAEGLASGLYFYRLHTTEVSLFNKMMFLK